MPSGSGTGMTRPGWTPGRGCTASPPTSSAGTADPRSGSTAPWPGQGPTRRRSRSPTGPTTGSAPPRPAASSPWRSRNCPPDTATHCCWSPGPTCHTTRSPTRSACGPARSARGSAGLEANYARPWVTPIHPPSTRSPRMNEMDQLTRFRAEVPPGVSPRAEQLFIDALESQRLTPDHPHHLPRTHRRTLRPAVPLRFALAGLTATAVAVGMVVALPSSRPGDGPLTVKLLADRAAAAALATPALTAGQWVYERTENYNALRGRSGHPNPEFQEGWLTADGSLSYGAGSIGDPIFPYDKLDSLPRDPASLLRYFRSQDSVASDDNSSVEFFQITEMLFAMVLPPWLQAEMYQALALIPGVQVRQDVKDIAGRAGVAFLLPETRQSDQHEIILDASDYHLLAQGDWGTPNDAATFSEDAILTTVLVDELGSTQPATAPPSAVQIAAEQLVWDGMFSKTPPPRLTSDQWVYHDLRTGGTDRQVWATADDTVQAENVNGTLQVCKRTDPCAASEQWLVPAGPSYPLVYPSPLNALTQAELAKLRNEPIKERRAALDKLFENVKQQPTLPFYPRPLLDKLNTYSTGCTDVAGDCNAVNVIADMLTGYGNHASTASGWFFALADVPGVSVQQVTDSAGRQATEFTFPFHDGVTSILASGGYHEPG